MTTLPGKSSLNIRLSQLVPPLLVAWADGSVAERERDTILRIASLRGVSEGTATYSELERWMDERPSDEIVREALAFLRSELCRRPKLEAEYLALELHARCEEVASASRSFWGIGVRVNEREREMLRRIAVEIRPFLFANEPNWRMEGGIKEKS